VANDCDIFAEAYSAENESSLLNAYYERPAILTLPATWPAGAYLTPDADWMARQSPELYAASVERTGSRQRFAQFLTWQPSTYKQVWLAAVIGGGVLVSILMSVVFSAAGQRSWLARGLAVGVASAVISGALGSWSLNWRRNQGR
jgi:hypothetical protein